MSLGHLVNSAARQLKLAKADGSDCVGVVIKLAAFSEKGPDLVSESSWASSRSNVQINIAKVEKKKACLWLLM